MPWFWSSANSDSNYQSIQPKATLTVPLPTTIPEQVDDVYPPASSRSRHLKQFGLCLAGAGCLAASIAVARRSVLRKQLESIPRFYVSNRHIPEVDPADRQILAAQALSLATLNVTAFGIFVTGGLSWAFDLSTVTELRQRTRTSLMKSGNLDVDDEKALEEMMDSLLSKLGMDNSLPKEDVSTPPRGDSGDVKPRVVEQ